MAPATRGYEPRTRPARSSWVATRYNERGSLERRPLGSSGSTRQGAGEGLSSHGRSVEARARRLEPADRGGQVFAGDQSAVAEKDRALDRVAQLADVAGPGVGEQPLAGVSRDSRGGTAHALAQLLEEGFGQ